MIQKTLMPQIWVPQFVPGKAHLPSFTIRTLMQLVDCCACTSDGFGFCSSRGGPPYLETTKFAVALLSFAAWNGETRPVRKFRDGCIRYLLELHRPGSGFSDTPDGESLVFATYYGLSALRLLDALDDKVEEGAKRFLKINAEPDGRPKCATFPSDMTHLLWGVTSASLLNSAREIYGHTVPRFIAQCSNGDGSYRISPSAQRQKLLQPTVESMIVRNLLGVSVEPSELEAIRGFLLSCRQGDEFGASPGIRGSPRDWLFGAIGLYGMTGEAAVSPITVNTRDLWRAYATTMIHLVNHSGLGIVEGAVRKM